MGPDCNKLEGKKCWNPVTGAATTATCGANDYQCKVKYPNIKKISKGSKVKDIYFDVSLKD